LSFIYSRKSLPPKLKRRPKPEGKDSSKGEKYAPEGTGMSNHYNSNNNTRERVRPASALASPSTGSLGAAWRTSASNGTLKSNYSSKSTSNGTLKNNSSSKSTSNSSTLHRDALTKSSVFDALTTSNTGSSSSGRRSRNELAGAAKSKRRPRTDMSLPRPARPKSVGPEISQKTSTLRREHGAGSGTVSSVSTLARKEKEKKLAFEDFTKLIIAQQNHLNGQTKTLNSIDTVLQRKEVDWKNAQVTSAAFVCKDLDSIQLEIANLERAVANNQATLLSEEALLDRLNEDEQSALTKQIEIEKVKSDTLATERNVQDLQHRLQQLEEEVTREQKIQKQRKNKAACEGLKLEMRKLKVEGNRINEMVRTTTRGVEDVDADIVEKNGLLESLNRELRQLSLQQFIHKTGTKVTVLPPENNKQNDNTNPTTTTADSKQINSLLSSRLARISLTSQKSAEEGGYWV